MSNQINYGSVPAKWPYPIKYGEENRIETDVLVIGAGVSGGAGFVETLKQEGAMLFVYGACMTLIPMLVGYFVAAKLMKLSLFNNLGSITGGMTSTPALGTLISVAGTDDVASAYAATYPIALVSVVLCSQFIVLLLR